MFGIMNAFKAYLIKVGKAIKRGDATEHTHRSALQSLTVL